MEFSIEMQNMVKKASGLGFSGKENMISKNFKENVVFDINNEIANMKMNITLEFGKIYKLKGRDYEIEVECYN